MYRFTLRRSVLRRHHGGKPRARRAERGAHGAKQHEEHRAPGHVSRVERDPAGQFAQPPRSEANRDQQHQPAKDAGSKARWLHPPVVPDLQGAAFEPERLDTSYDGPRGSQATSIALDGRRFIRRWTIIRPSLTHFEGAEHRPIMKIASSKFHVRMTAELMAAMFAFGCAGADPTRSDSANPGTMEHAGPESAGPNVTSRVVGYLPTYRPLDPSGIDLDTLTHLNLAFVAPKTDQPGSPLDFVKGQPDEIKNLITAAHEKHVKVLGALGGGTDGPRVSKALALDPQAFLNSTLEFLDRYGLDGIDIDIEGEAIEPITYEKLVTGLVAQLPAGKLLTAAVANYMRGNYRALDKVDFLNVMSYDQCGSWSEAPCPHSTYTQAEHDLEYWSTEYWKTAGGVFDKANVVLGVPFYGRCWGAGCLAFTGDPAQMEAPTYQQVLAFWSKNEGGNPMDVPDLLEDKTYYLSLNSRQTIESKAILAKNYGGIMIWELGQDAEGPSSLFSAIKNAR